MINQYLRYGTTSRNGRSFIDYEEMVRNAVANRLPEQPITSIQQDLIDLLNEENFDQLRLESVLFHLVWVVVLETFHSVVSDPKCTLKNARGAVNDVRLKMNSLLQLGVEGILVQADQMNLSKASNDAIEKVKLLWANASDQVMVGVNDELVRCLRRMNEKVVKDFEVFDEIDKDESYILPMTNRSTVSKLYINNDSLYFQERSFSYLKLLDGRFVSMTDDRIAITAICRQNHLASWLGAQGDWEDLLRLSRARRNQVMTDRRAALEEFAQAEFEKFFDKDLLESVQADDLQTLSQEFDSLFSQ